MTFRPSQAKLLSPVSTEEQEAIQRSPGIPYVSESSAPQIRAGSNETRAKKDGLIKYDLSRPGDWSEVILKGIQIGVGESDVQVADRKQQ